MFRLVLYAYVDGSLNGTSASNIQFPGAGITANNDLENTTFG